ncbi:acyl-CoA thioesterase II [Aestuariicella hydrocarbonica]|uniref:Acyl-CoA thioesterase 2 n=1 Tax=Pseudomaricurvus hydrocarbonicus TaxID=1470433 RepID=A0A9E5JVW6_9GAMM|nr:acyl-CoA thioesterase II [Aestuariicella hydrocarbonica]NHO65505.1 acyl-CoA thioesterase II [Aestuariicella hydrocarbonica]
MTNSTEQLAEIIELEQLDTLLFRGTTPKTELPRVFGGQVLAQALNAAIRTVPESRQMHSMHAYFLRPGDTSRPIIFEVDPIRDGNSFTTRRVVAIQNGKAIFNTSLSFKIPEEGLEHQVDMPDVPAPESLTPDRERMQEYRKERPDASPPPPADALGAFEVRTNGDLPFLQPKGSEPVHGFWFKCRDKLDRGFPMHQAFLAYASDFRLLASALLPHEVRFSDNGNSLQAATLDHCIWIHADFRVDDWIYYHMEGPVAAGGRGLNFGRFYTRDGRLVASTSQEGLMRLRSAKA